MKRIFTIVGLILFVLLILGFIAPKEYTIERSIAIDAPRNHVYEHYMSSLEGLYIWSTDRKDDLTTRTQYTGTPGTVESTAHWHTGHGIREGREKVIQIVPFHKIQTEIRHIKPWESLNHAYISVNGEGNSCNVNWKFEGHNPFPFNIRHLFIDSDQKFGPDYENGLKRLKEQAENSYLKKRLGIVIDSIEPMKLAYFDARHTANSTIDKFLHGEEDNLISLLQKVKVNQVGNPRLLLYMFSRDSILLTVPIPSDATLDQNGLKSIDFPECLALTASHTGSYEGLRKMHDEISGYLDSQGWSYKWPLREEYVITASNQPDTTKWLTLIRYELYKEK